MRRRHRNGETSEARETQKRRHNITITNLPQIFSITRKTSTSTESSSSCGRKKVTTSKAIFPMRLASLAQSTGNAPALVQPLPAAGSHVLAPLRALHCAIAGSSANTFLYSPTRLVAGVPPGESPSRNAGEVARRAQMERASRVQR